MSATNVLKRAELQLRTLNVQEDLQSKNEEKIHKVAEEAGISKTICDEVLTENLGTHLVSAKFVPCLLSEDQ